MWRVRSMKFFELPSQKRISNSKMWPRQDKTIHSSLHPKKALKLRFS